VGEAIAQRSVGGVLGSSIRVVAIGRSRPPPSASPTPPPRGEDLVGATWPPHAETAERMGRVRSARASPGRALMFCTVSTKCRRFAWSRYPEAFGSRILNPLRWRPPTGGELTTSPDRPGDFSPGLLRSPATAAPRLRPLASERLPRTDRGVHLRTAGERFPLDHPRRPHRSPYVRPPLPSGAVIIGVVRRGEDQIGSRKIRALKSWSFVRYPPSIDAPPARPTETLRTPPRRSSSPWRWSGDGPGPRPRARGGRWPHPPGRRWCGPGAGRGSSPGR